MSPSNLSPSSDWLIVNPMMALSELNVKWQARQVGFLEQPTLRIICI
jgi:hypothetical protein